MELAFAGLHQLCAPLLDRARPAARPAARRARGSVFGLAAGPAPDRFLVGLAVLSLFSEAAEERPLLCVVDDAQWLDQTSALTLALRRPPAAGRAGRARVRGARARRGAAAPAGARGARAAERRRPRTAELVGAVRCSTSAVRDRILAETRGNPLALLELPRGLTADAAGRRVRDAGSAAISRSGSRGATSGDSMRFPEDARRLLLVAAAEPVGDPLLVQRACERLGIAPSAVDATDGLLAVGERVTFRHPLARSAVYRSASGPERRATHLALAEVDESRRRSRSAGVASGRRGSRTGRGRRARARALGAPGAGARRPARPRPRSCSARWRVTGDPTRRADRALAAAQASLGAGAFDVARGLLSRRGRRAARRARAGPRGSAAGRDRLRPEPRWRRAAAAAAGRAAARAARRAPLRATPTSTRGARRCSPGTWRRPGGRLLDVSRAVGGGARAHGWPALARDLLLDGLALIFTAGRARRRPRCGARSAAFASSEVSVDEVLRWGWLATRAAIWLWDYDSGLEIGERARCSSLATRARSRSSPSRTTSCGQAAALGGDFARAEVLVAEVDAVREATGDPHRAVRRDLALAGLRGREAEAVGADRRPSSTEPPPAARAPPSSTRTGRTPC